MSPEFSIIIPTYNRCGPLRTALESIAHLDPGSPSFEVLVVDNASNDSTPELLRSLRTPYPLRLVHEPRPGANYARNTGVRSAQGNIMCFIDDDVRVSPHWLSSMRQAFQRHAPACVGGRIVIGTDFKRPAWWHASFERHLGFLDLGNEVVVGQAGSVIAMFANMAIPRRIFERHGELPTPGRAGRSLTMGDESEYYWLLQQRGEKTIYAPEPFVWHDPDLENRLTLSYMNKSFYACGEYSGLSQVFQRSYIMPTRRAFPKIFARTAREAALHPMRSTCVGLALACYCGGYVRGALKRWTTNYFS